MDVIGEVINKGVPISTPISVRCNDLLLLCEDKKLVEEKINNEFKKYESYLNSKFKKTDFNIFLTMSININPKTLEKKLIFSLDGLITSLMYNLNFDNVCNSTDVEANYYDFDLDDIKPRIERLKKINADQKLRKEFPVIYKSYKMIVETRKLIEEIKKKTKLSPTTNKFIFNTSLCEILKQYGVNIDVPTIEMVSKVNIISYCKDVAESFENIIDHIDEISDYLENNPFSLDDVTIDKEKLELYFTYRFLKEIEINDDLDKQNFVYYVADYFRENSKRKTSEFPRIIVDSVVDDGIVEKKEGKEITPKDVYLEFRELLLENPEIKPINFNNIDFKGMSLEEVKNVIEESLKTYTANWEIIPKGEFPKVGYELLKENKKKEIDYEKLKQLFMDKTMLYTELDPYMVIRGKNTFNGYMGYIFSNGKVILDKFYENAEKGIVSKGDAIYYMNIDDFYELSHHTKSELIKNPKVGRIIHKGPWQEAVIKISTSDGDDIKTNNETTKLIRSKVISSNN